ncbi:MAG: outer membrane protein assembly factor BamD [Prevotella sp.]|nr:outer membrane protein assembly factor BamD [Prevotella sp.]
MRQRTTAYLALLTAMLLAGCTSEYNRVYRSTDYNYKYEYAKQLFSQGKYSQAGALLSDVVLSLKGTENGQESLYMLGMTQYLSHDYELASETFKKYGTTYPKGMFAEKACFYVGQSLYESAPEPRLDQTPTIGALNAYQQFIELYPKSSLRPQATAKLYELQDKLIIKELLNAQLYYNLGGYFGNCTNGGSNLEACIITAQNALKTYPFTDKREDFALLIMKSKYELAQQSVEEKKMERYRDAEDECYGFLNEYPDSKNTELAHKYIARCKKVTGD